MSAPHPRPAPQGTRNTLRRCPRPAGLHRLYFFSLADSQCQLQVMNPLLRCLIRLRLRGTSSLGLRRGILRSQLLGFYKWRNLIATQTTNY